MSDAAMNLCKYEQLNNAVVDKIYCFVQSITCQKKETKTDHYPKPCEPSP